MKIREATSEVKESKVVCPFCKQVHEVVWDRHSEGYVGKTPPRPHWTGEYLYKVFFVFRAE